MASILLIDDDAGFCTTTAEVLRLAGHEVRVAASGEAGLALYRAMPCDLILADIVMPEMGGLELIERLRQTDPRPRVIAMSGGNAPHEPCYLATARRLGVERTLAKPIFPRVLLRAVAEVLAEPAQPTEAPQSAVKT